MLLNVLVKCMISMLYRYLEAFERINFFGEDAEDVLVSQNARPHTPVSVGLLSGTSGTKFKALTILKFS